MRKPLVCIAPLVPISIGTFSILLGCSLPLPASETNELKWNQESGCRWSLLSVPEAGHTGFTRLPPNQTGIAFTHIVPEQRHLTNQILLDGSGVAAADVDGDGRCDLFFCHMGGTSRLYRNLGNWKFEDITDAAGVGFTGIDVTGAVLVDVDGDGDADLIVNTRGTGTRVMINDGKGHFVERLPRLNADSAGTTLALADVDGDGYLDLYIANYRPAALMDIPNARATFKKVNGKLVMDRLDGRPTSAPDLTNRFVLGPDGRLLEVGQVDALYLNRGGTNWTLVSFTNGAFLDEEGKPLTESPFDWGLTAMFRDINGDGLPDLYVCNDFQSPDRFWINQGGGRFRAVSKLALRRTSYFSMGVDFADINRDGQDDFFVVDMLHRDHGLRMRQTMAHPLNVPAIGDLETRPQYGQNTLFVSRGDGTFTEVAQVAGLEATEWSWSPVFLDVDLDGWEDVLVATGQARAGREADVIEQLGRMRAARAMSDAEVFDARRKFPSLPSGMLAYRNQHDLKFRETTAEWGLTGEELSHGMCLADLDGDGDLDVIVNNLNGPAGVFRNDSSAPRVAVRLKGTAPNTAGIGAKVWLYDGAVPMQSQEIISGGRYLSSDEPMRTFAAGSVTNEMRIEVRWRSGKQSVISGVKANRLYEIDEAAGAGDSPAQKSALPPRPFFEDVSALIAHTHHEEAFDDFERQPLLPRKLSQLGPGISWHDVNGDGWDDLIIGSGKGGKMEVFQNDTRGGFRRMTNAPVSELVPRDQTTVLGWDKSPGAATILVGSASYEDHAAKDSAVRQYDLATGTINDSLPAQIASSGPLALGDWNGDGHLSLFIGGRVIPGRWPEPASSSLYRCLDGRWQLDAENTKQLAGVGLVSGAVFSDLNGDGLPELVLACEWGPLKLFRNQNGKLTEWDPPVTMTTNSSHPTSLSQFTGWWNGVTTGDLDGDGRLDIIASNWGRNSPYESHRTQALRLYYGDFADNDAVDIVEAYFDPMRRMMVPEVRLDVLAKGIPRVRELFSTHHAYGEASVEQILSGRTKRELAATTLESMVFLNRGDHFEAHALPDEAQWSPAFGVCVGDYDGDGHEDVFLSQNCFAVPEGSVRFDGGRGLWLRGDGTGQLVPVPGQISGVKIYGEQRGAALCDYDGDGRVDLAVAQNGSVTKLYRNVGGRPGLRIRLQGSASNPTGIGAQLRLKFGERSGPVRELHAGSGYWSQDSAVQVMATPSPPTEVWIRWPGGKAVTYEVPKGAKEIEVSESGLKLLRGDH